MSQIAVFDTSAIVKRYIPSERGYERVTAVCADDAVQVAVSRFAGVEIASALARRAESGELTGEERSEAWDAWRADLDAQYRALPIDEATLEAAEGVVARHRIRALDALHVATALVFSEGLGPGDALTFSTADRRQADAARAAGLVVDFFGEG